MLIAAIKSGIKAARSTVETEAARRVKVSIREIIYDYLDTLSDEKAARVITRIMGAEGLTDAQIKRFVDMAKHDVFIEIHFGNGDVATISNRDKAGKGGPGW